MDNLTATQPIKKIGLTEYPRKNGVFKWLLLEEKYSAA